jgi:hypothetical protein
MWGKGSTKRPDRPQIEQHSQKPARISCRRGDRTRSSASAGVVIVSSQPNGAGEMTEWED